MGRNDSSSQQLQLTWPYLWNPNPADPLGAFAIIRSGLAVGGNFRWRSASTIGYERKLNAAGRPLGVIDVSRPIEGEEYWEFGLMISRQFRLAHGRSLRLQLNIENPLDWDDSRVVATDYDSQGYYGTTDAIIPIRYELRRPRNFTLTATYTF